MFSTHKACWSIFKRISPQILKIFTEFRNAKKILILTIFQNFEFPYTSTWRVVKLYILVESGNFHFSCNSATFAWQELCVTVTKLQVKSNPWHWFQVIWRVLHYRHPMITFVTIWSHLTLSSKESGRRSRYNHVQLAMSTITHKYFLINFINFKWY